MRMNVIVQFWSGSEDPLEATWKKSVEFDVTLPTQAAGNYGVPTSVMGGGSDGCKSSQYSAWSSDSEMLCLVSASGEGYATMSRVGNSMWLYLWDLAGDESFYDAKPMLILKDAPRHKFDQKHRGGNVDIMRPHNMSILYDTYASWSVY